MSQPRLPSPTSIGVGIDTSRYGHHATFLRDDLQPAAADLDFPESAAGYDRFRRRLATIVERYGSVHFHVRLDVAGASGHRGVPKLAGCGLRGLTPPGSPGGGRAVDRLRASTGAAPAGARPGALGTPRPTPRSLGPGRGPCPVHAPDGEGRTFSVNLDQNVFHCFDATCGIRGDVIDLWAALTKQSLRASALELVRTFGLEPTLPTANGTEERHG